jgi:hypothetical protein
MAALSLVICIGFHFRALHFLAIHEWIVSLKLGSFALTALDTVVNVTTLGSMLIQCVESSGLN